MQPKRKAEKHPVENAFRGKEKYTELKVKWIEKIRSYNQIGNN